MPTTDQNFKRDVQEGVETLGKLYRGLVSLGKEVLPKDTKEFVKKAEQPLEELKHVATSFANAIHGMNESSTLDPRAAAKKKYPLEGEAAFNLEKALTLAEQSGARDAKEKDRLRCLILQVVDQVEKGADAKSAIQTLKAGLTPS